MKVLLDTHALLWWLFDDPKLSAKAKRAIKNPDNVIFASTASAWEMATKYRLGKLPGAELVVRQLPALLQSARIEPLPISMEHALAAGNLPGPHRDPFDRMLIAQARLENLPIVTLDEAFKGYGVKIIW
ncbi:MAG TPA: type II toxin-antitoxin system VapC family toxin [Gammaproteobacteria bacterium]|nr:type II toxin-antitoxin system VapC family toxin [Gammaproteobacteria bacterium]